jgi:hypothetical protein
MNNNEQNYLNKIKENIVKKISDDINEGSIDKIIEKILKICEDEKKFINFQEYYFTILENKKYLLKEPNFFREFKVKYSIQVIDKEYLDGLEKHKSEIYSLIINNKLSELYFDNFYKAKIKTNNNEPNDDDDDSNDDDDDSDDVDETNDDDDDDDDDKDDDNEETRKYKLRRRQLKEKLKQYEEIYNIKKDFYIFDKPNDFLDLSYKKTCNCVKYIQDCNFYDHEIRRLKEIINPKKRLNQINKNIIIGEKPIQDKEIGRAHV